MSEIGQFSPDKTPPAPTINDWIVPTNIVLITPSKERLIVDTAVNRDIRAVSAIWAQAGDPYSGNSQEPDNKFGLVRILENEGTNRLSDVIRPLGRIEGEVEQGTFSSQGDTEKQINQGAAAQLVAQYAMTELKRPVHKYNAHGEPETINLLIGGVLLAQVDAHNLVKRAFLTRSTVWEIGSVISRCEAASSNYHWSSNPKNRSVSQIMESIPATIYTDERQDFVLNVGLRVIRSAMKESIKDQLSVRSPQLESEASSRNR